MRRLGWSGSRVEVDLEVALAQAALLDRPFGDRGCLFRRPWEAAFATPSTCTPAWRSSDERGPVALTVSFATEPAFASTASEEQQGAAFVKALNTGKRSCETLTLTDFERIGEYAMGLNF